jgi:hypothetical protein
MPRRLALQPPRGLVRESSASQGLIPQAVRRGPAISECHSEVAGLPDWLDPCVVVGGEIDVALESRIPGGIAPCLRDRWSGDRAEVAAQDFRKSHSPRKNCLEVLFSDSGWQKEAPLAGEATSTTTDLT